MASRPPDATRHLDIVHFVPHSVVRGDQLLEARLSTIIIHLVQITHHGSGVGMRGRIEQVAQVAASAVADKICVVCRSAVRNGPCASPKDVVQALCHIFESVCYAVALCTWSGAEDFIVNDEIVGWPSMSLDGRVGLYMPMSVLLSITTHKNERKADLRIQKSHWWASVIPRSVTVPAGQLPLPSALPSVVGPKRV